MIVEGHHCTYRTFLSPIVLGVRVKCQMQTDACRAEGATFPPSFGAHPRSPPSIIFCWVLQAEERGARAIKTCELDFFACRLLDDSSELSSASALALVTTFHSRRPADDRALSAAAAAAALCHPLYSTTWTCRPSPRGRSRSRSTPRTSTPSCSGEFWLVGWLVPVSIVRRRRRGVMHKRRFAGLLPTALAIALLIRCNRWLAVAECWRVGIIQLMIRRAGGLSSKYRARGASSRPRSNRERSVASVVATRERKG